MAATRQLGYQLLATYRGDRKDLKRFDLGKSFNTLNEDVRHNDVGALSVTDLQTDFRYLRDHLGDFVVHYGEDFIGTLCANLLTALIFIRHTEESTQRKSIAYDLITDTISMLRAHFPNAVQLIPGTLDL